MEKKVRIYIALTTVIILIGVMLYSRSSVRVRMIIDILTVVIPTACLAIFASKNGIRHIIEMARLNKKIKKKNQEKAKKKKTIPIYYNKIPAVCIICVYAIFLVVLLSNALLSDEFFSKYREVREKYRGIFLLLSLIVVITFYIILRQKKMLYLYKDNEKVLIYNDNITDSLQTLELRKYLKIPRAPCEKEYLIKEKCEHIQLKNNVDFWSCYSKSYEKRRGGTYRRHYEFIFMRVPYNNDVYINIILNNNVNTYTCQENLFISNYSNLPPFVTIGANSKDICPKIEKTCSDFFAKTRSKYILRIKDGEIEIGLKSGRFGKCNRIWNKEKTVKLIDEAIEEMSDFILQIKSIVEWRRCKLRPRKRHRRFVSLPEGKYITNKKGDQNGDMESVARM